MSNKINLSRHSINMIANLQHISNKILFQPGPNIRVMNTAETCFCDVVLEETFPVQFGILEMNTLIGVFNLPAFRGNDLEIDFQESHMVISSGPSKVRYRYAHTSLISLPDDEFELSDVDFQADVEWDTLKTFTSSCQQLGLTLLEFIVDGDRLKLNGTNPKLGDESNDYTVDIGENTAKFEDCRYGILSSYINLFEGSYQISVDGTGLAEFRNLDSKIVYHVGVELAL